MIKHYLRNHIEIIKEDVAKIWGVGERTVRHYIKDLRTDEEPCIFIPIYNSLNSGTYRQIEHCTREQIDQHINIQKAHVQSVYFDTLLPLKKYMTQQQQNELYQFMTLFGVNDEINI